MQTPDNPTPARPHRPDSPETPLLVSVPEAAHLLGIGKTIAWDMVRSGELPKVKLRGRVLVPRTALERLAGAHETVGVDHSDM